MRTISLVVDAFGVVTPNNISVGSQGEHNVSTLLFKPNEKITSAVGYFRVILGDYLSERLYAKNQEVTYSIPQCVMLTTSPLLIQLEGYSVSDDGEVLRIFKSDIVTAKVKHSIEPTHEVSDQVLDNAESAITELAHYVDNGTALAESMGSMVEDCEEKVEKCAEKVSDCAEILKAAEETLQNKANFSDIPSKVSELENDSGYLVASDINSKAEKSKTLDYITYSISKGKVTITGCDTSISGTHVIPDTINGYRVASFNDSVFLGCEALTSIVIPNSITRLGNNTFKNCTSLESVTLGNGISNIGGDAFSGCTALTKIEIPNSVSIIYSSAFSGCTNLTDVVMGDSVTAIHASAFYGCSSLKSIKIGNSVTSIGVSAFNRCPLFASVTIPASVTSIGNNAFSNTALTDVYYNGTKEQWDAISLDKKYSTALTNANIYYKYGSVPTPTKDTDAATKGYVDSLQPTKVSELENDSGYLVPSDIEDKANISQKVLVQNGDTITLADNTTYYAENTINTLTVVYPETDFIASLDITLADDGDITLTLPQSKYIGGVPTFANGETWELNIKNGVVVGGLIE